MNQAPSNPSADDIADKMHSCQWSEKGIRELLSDDELSFAIAYMFKAGTTINRLLREQARRKAQR